MIRNPKDLQRYDAHERANHWLVGICFILLALSVVTAIQSVGVVLTSAMLVTPAATASLLTQRLFPMFLISISVATISSASGLYASYYFSVSSGGAIVLCCTALFGTALSWQTFVRNRQPLFRDRHPNR